MFELHPWSVGIAEANSRQRPRTKNLRSSIASLCRIASTTPASVPGSSSSAASPFSTCSLNSTMTLFMAAWAALSRPREEVESCVRNLDMAQKTMRTLRTRTALYMLDGELPSRSCSRPC